LFASNEQSDRRPNCRKENREPLSIAPGLDCRTAEAPGWETLRGTTQTKENPMKFLMTYVQSPKSAPPTPEHGAAIAKFTQEMAASGVLLMTGGLQRATKGTQIKLAGGKFTATDGPFAETKELIDGFALVQTKSREEAIELARRFMNIAGDGEGEVLQVFDAPEALR
jgi:hypothetical protein